MARYDRESINLYKDSPKEPKGTLQLGKHKVTYYKQDWDDIAATGLTNAEKGKNQRAHLKADEGFKILGRAEFVVTDKLHGHIMSSIIGTPHVLLDSGLGKNFAYHDTWTINCNCVRAAESWAETLEYATMFFEKAYNEGRWRPLEEREAAEKVEMA
jgi:exopolysaccharide biosynthesis predicted pyruvyltransferase EpsI